MSAAEDLDRLAHASEAESMQATGPTVKIIKASTIKPEPIRWLWEGWLARGKLHILAGAPGTGKTTISMAMAATVTTGGRWPDGSCCPTGNVLIWSGEDDPQDTLVPRLLAAGANSDRVFFVGETQHKPGETRAFDPAHDLAALQRALVTAGNVRLMIVDPVVSAVNGDSHKNTEVRRALQPLVDMASKLDCVMLGISHFSKSTGGKDPAERVTGSVAFSAMARVVLATAKTQSEDGERAQVLARAKSNIGPDHGGFVYHFEQCELEQSKGVFASRILWGEALAGSARELLGDDNAGGEDDSERKDAKRFLIGLLENGPLPSKTIRGDTEGAGYSWATIRRAQRDLGIEVTKEGMKGGWFWSLPRRCSQTAEDAQQNKVSTFGKFEHLQDQVGQSDANWLAAYEQHDVELDL